MVCDDYVNPGFKEVIGQMMIYGTLTFFGATNANTMRATSANMKTPTTAMY